MKIIIDKNPEGFWYWKLVAPNGVALCGSYKAYTTKKAAVHNLRAVSNIFTTCNHIVERECRK